MQEKLITELQDIYHAIVGAFAAAIAIAILQYAGAHIIPLAHAAGEAIGGFIGLKVSK